VRWLVGARPLPVRQEDVYALMSMEGINNQAVDQVCRGGGWCIT
jgi:hypothetical protein